MRKVEKFEELGHSEAPKKFFRQSLLIFPVLQKLTHMGCQPEVRFFSENLIIESLCEVPTPPERSSVESGTYREYNYTL